MNEILKLVNDLGTVVLAIAAILGSLSTIVGFLIKAKVVKGKQVAIFKDLLDKGHTEMEALAKVALTKKDVAKIK